MLDDNFKVYLIEVNDNPSLELSNSYLSQLIPMMLDNAFRLVVDPLFPPPDNLFSRRNSTVDLTPENKFELIFDERIDGPELSELFKGKVSEEFKRN
jgi:hypothetical protein